VAAYCLYGGPAIVIDLGTAITFDVISADAAYLGGLIYPGIGISLSGLFAKTALLPQVNFEQPSKLIGTTTVGSIQSGLYYGTMGMVDGLIERLAGELGGQPQVIATGGQAPLIRAGSRLVQHLDEDLTLKGLRLLWERN
jgi:type III pantothenate kinase